MAELIRRPFGPSAVAGLRLWVVGWMALVCLAGCGPAPDAEPIVLGLLTETSTSEGSNVRDTIDLLTRQVNARGGVLVAGRARPLTIVSRTTYNTPEGSARAALELINHEHVVALLGPTRSQNAIPAAEVAESLGVPMLSLAATHPQVTAGKHFSFRVNFLDAQQGAAMAQFADQILKVRRAAMLYDVANTYNRSVAHAFAETFQRLGGEIVADLTYITGQPSFADQLEPLLELRPEVLFLPNYETDIARQLVDLQAVGLDVIILGADGWNPHELLSADGNGVVGEAYVAQSWHQRLLKDEADKDFALQYEGANGRPLTGSGALAHDGLILLLDAIQRSVEQVEATDGKVNDATLRPAAIRDALAATQGVTGLTGTFDFVGRRGDPLKPVVILRIQGKASTFWTVVTPGGEPSGGEPSGDGWVFLPPPKTTGSPR